MPDSWLPTLEGDSPTAAVEAVVRKGKGSRKTQAFELAECDYTLTFKKKGPCHDDYTSAVLFSANSDYRDEYLSQDDCLYGAEAGRYYWDVNAWEGKCQWTLTLAPLG